MRRRQRHRPPKDFAEWVGYWMGIYLRAIRQLRRERDEARAEVAALRQRVGQETREPAG